jgi:hypothetical protein
MKFDLLDKILLGVILLLVAGLIFKRCRPCEAPTPSEATIIMVGDTAQASIYKQQAEMYKEKADSLEKVKRKIITKYETLYISTAPMPVIDSVYRANL